MSTSESSLQSAIVKTQPKETFHPSDFVAIEDLDELLDKHEGIGGFELLADSHIFIVRKREPLKPEKGDWSTTSIFDISDENVQILFVARKEILYKCFLANVTTISILTDNYKDPIFLVVLKYTGKGTECCKISTLSGKTIGTVQKDDKTDGTGFVAVDKLDKKTLRVTPVQFDGGSFVYDVWDGPTLVGGLSSENLTVTIYSAGSTTASVKLILMGFSFYLDGLTRGDDRKFNLF